MGGNNYKGEGVGVLVLTITVLLSGFIEICSAKSYVVGGSTGWTVPTSASFYPSWASKNKLQLGDVLVFTFPAGVHTVAEVSKPNYDACTSANTLGPVMATAPANITLTKPGTHYYICTVAGHCLANQKLSVTVSAASSPSPKSSSPAPSPSTSSPVASPAPAPAPTSTPTLAPVPVPVPVPAPSTAIPTAPAAAFGPGPSTVPAEAGTPEGGPGAATPPAGNVAAATAGVSILSLLSMVAMSLLF